MKEELKNLLAQGNTKEVIKKLLEQSQSFTNEDLRREINLVSSRYNDYEDLWINNLTSEENLQITKNQIHNTLYNLINKVYSDTLEDVTSTSNDSKAKFNLWKIIGSAAIIIGIIAGIAEFSGYSLWDFLAKPSTETPSNTNPEEQESTQNTDKANPAQQQDINISTEGDQSPAIHSDGDVDINYGDSKPAKKDTKEPAEPKEQKPPPSGGLNIKTKGDQSPAIKGENVTISYGLEDEPTQRDTSGNQ